MDFWFTMGFSWVIGGTGYLVLDSVHRWFKFDVSPRAAAWALVIGGLLTLVLSG